MSALAIAAAGLAVAAALSLAGGGALWRRRFRGSSLILFLIGLLLLLLGVSAVLIEVGTRGYRALVREEVAATVRLRPVGPGSFDAGFTFPDGETRTYRLAGDQLYVDAHILKWRPLVNVLGLHTEYELDRVAGRWSDLEEERSRPRTVHDLGRRKPFDFFDVARSVPLFDPLVDVEYGSASFIETGEGGTFELRVSTTGLLLRSLEAETR